MRISLDASPAKLHTSYIDILYLHWWDWNASVEEIMDGLHQLVLTGKVLGKVLGPAGHSPGIFSHGRRDLLTGRARSFCSQHFSLMKAPMFLHRPAKPFSDPLPFF